MPKYKEQGANGMCISKRGGGGYEFMGTTDMYILINSIGEVFPTLP